ncbi:MAG: hypothetical protein IJK44_08845 [Bacteroidales bacterium]|nr:hypothetical protein [Bacteroidales bacterium]
MREIVHLCMSSHDEVMFRNEADLAAGFNTLALKSYQTDSRILAEGFITTHFHTLAQTDDYHLLMRRFRYCYTRYFNSKYKRKGSLGEKKWFSMKIDGAYHLMTALNYVMRQGLHHGLASTPFGYRHCSANVIFRKELGKNNEPVLIDDDQVFKYLPDRHKLPKGWRMDENGLILREDVIDTSYVEQVYITPRNYLFQMNRITDDKVLEDQKKENTLPPVTLDSIEQGVQGFDVQKALVNEQGRINRTIMTDLELCHLIDDVLLPRYIKDPEEQSIYLLPISKRHDMGNILWHASGDSNKKDNLLGGKTVSPSQIRRCLAL